MDRSWYVRTGLTVAVIVAALYALVPTFVYFRMPPETRNDREAFEKELPGWAPKRRVNLGLDLQGGVHLVLGVDLDKAVRDKVARRADELRTWAQQKSLKTGAITALPQEQQVRIAFASADDANAFDAVAKEYWNDMNQLRSGTESVWAFQKQSIDQFRESAVDQALRTIRNRVDSLGVTEPTIAKRGLDAIVVQLPGFKNPEQAKELLGRTAQLEFKIVADDEAAEALSSFGALPEGVTRSSDGSQPYLTAAERKTLEKLVAGKAPAGFEFAIGRIETARQGLPSLTSYRTYLLRSKVEVGGDRLTDARPQLDTSMGGAKPYVSLTFDKEGATQFEQVTGANIGKRLAIVLDDSVDSAPVIQSKISGGNAQITLGGMKGYDQLLKEANDLSLVLRSGALPAPVQIFEERSVGASLGPELIEKGALATLVGFVLVVLFMLVYYKVVGAIADLALLLNGVLLLAAMALAGATLTLPGIAGFVLTLGMAVDANVLINERIREELRAGKRPEIAVDNGYGKAFWTIFDANLTTLIAAIILMQYGTGPIRGFAVTLTIGLIASMFTAIVVTRICMDALVVGRKAESLSI